MSGKVLIFSDLHIVEPGRSIVGLDPSARLSEALEHALSRHGDATALILLGDLTHHGLGAEYAALEALLSACPLPIVATLGNHDRRAAYFARFRGAPRDPDGFAQSTLDLGSHRLIILDTLDEEGRAPRHGGYLCPRRLAWLCARLREDTRPTAVLCHHPPFPSGFDAMDAIGLQNAADLLAVLGQAPHANLIVCGHVHRFFTTAFQGLAGAVVASPCHQMPLRPGPGSSGMSDTSPGGYGLLLPRGDGWVLHGAVVGNHPEACDPGSSE